MKPLLITDCDEVLLHMVRHFGMWLGETHDIDFTMAHGDMASSMTRRDGGPAPDMWALLDGFFPAEMERQTLVPHAREALTRLAEQADIVVLTNLVDECRAPREAQLAQFDLHYRVVCNQGGKGMAVAALVAEYTPSVTVFVDDLEKHHESVAAAAPDVHRLHMISEPGLAPHVAPARHAHARIDDWREAETWIAARFADGVSADPIAALEDFA